MSVAVNIHPVEWLLFRALPVLVLFVAFTGVAVIAGSASPWNVVVHEDGRRTLLETIFYFEHATRELLPDALLACAIAGAARSFFPGVNPNRVAQVERLRRVYAVGCGAVVFFILSGTLWTGGASAIVDNLSQLHTRTGVELVWGSHWRYHLIERLALVLLAFSVMGTIWIVRGRPLAAPPLRDRLYGLSLAAFAVLTLMFRPTTEPFRDPRFLGHQSRELFTHALVTFPLAVGTCLGLSRHVWSAGQERSAESVRLVVLTGVLAVACGVFLLVASLLAGAQELGQSGSLGRLIFPHFAEHSLGYVFVPLLAGLLYVWPATGRTTVAGARNGQTAPGPGEDPSAPVRSPGTTA